MVTALRKTVRANPCTVIEQEGSERVVNKSGLEPATHQQASGALSPLGLLALNVIVIGSQLVSSACTPVGSATIV